MSTLSLPLPTSPKLIIFPIFRKVGDGTESCKQGPTFCNGVYVTQAVAGRRRERAAWGARAAGRHGGELPRGDVRRLLPLPVRARGRALLPPRAALPVRPGQ